MAKAASQASTPAQASPPKPKRKKAHANVDQGQAQEEQVTPLTMEQVQAELQGLTGSEQGLLTWLKGRGYELAENPFLSVDEAQESDKKATKSSFKHAWHLVYAPNTPRAPRLMVVYLEAWRGERVLGERLKRFQRKTLEYVESFKQGANKAKAPSLCVLACPEFAIVFDLTTQRYEPGRRLRFTSQLLSNTERQIYKAFLGFHAASLESYGDSPKSELAPNHQLAKLFALGEKIKAKQGLIDYDFKRLFVGEALDTDFVNLMGYLRHSLLKAVIEPTQKQPLLHPILKALDPEVDLTRETSALLENQQLKAGLIATVDTVLLRVVLYRYLEAQFGYKVEPEEERGVAFGTTYDELLKSTTQPNTDIERVERTQAEIIALARSEGATKKTSQDAQAPKTGKAKKARGKANKSTPREDQIELFSPSIIVQDKQIDAFKNGVHERNDYYQRQAGGDLHHGRVSEGADVLYRFLLEHQCDTYAFFLHGTSDERYSFAYADLDPRAFQRFYENTIGTDLRVNPKSKALEVLPWHQNRKEQGAYFTDERVAQYLVKRSLGGLFSAWEERFSMWGASVSDQAMSGPLKAKALKAAQADLRARLDELKGWQVIDPTMGGGIFLRAAFDFLASRYDLILAHLEKLPTEVWTPVVAEPPYKMFSSTEGDAQEGEWQWYVLLNMLYGVDIDIKAVNIASNLLTLSALTYKPQSVCFPSFINTNLKRGNALVVPLTDSREALLKRHQEKFIKLIALRAQLRDPSLPREAWLEVMVETERLTKEVAWQEAGRVFGQVFGAISDEAWKDRVERVGFFLYEAEFPEVFFTPQGELKDRSGFSVTLGNPPWEKLAATYKSFLPEFDPTYKGLKAKAAKDREEELLAQAHIKERWEAYEKSIEDQRALITSGFYQHQVAKVDGETYSGEGNLYQYATEVSLTILRPQGLFSMFIDSNLWSAQGATGLRRWIFDHHQVHELYLFVNKKKIFKDVVSMYKFGVVLIEKEPHERSDELKAAFMRQELSELEAVDQHLLTLDLKVIRESPTYDLPEVLDQGHWSDHCRFKSFDPLINVWEIECRSGDFHAGAQKGYFHTKKQKDHYPLISGAQFNLWGVHQGKLPESWLDPSEQGMGGWLRDKQEGRVITAIADWLEAKSGAKLPGKKKKAWAWAAAQLGQSNLTRLPDEWVRLDWEDYRIAWRDVCRSTDKRTLIAGIVPPKVGTSDKAPSIQPMPLTITSKGEVKYTRTAYQDTLILAGILSSFACDARARTMLAGIKMSLTIFKSLPIPPRASEQLERRIAELTARLTCLPTTKERPWADYTKLAESVGLTPERDGLIDDKERFDAEVELNALVAELYNYDRADYESMMRRQFLLNIHKEEHERVMKAVCERLPS